MVDRRVPFENSLWPDDAETFPCVPWDGSIALAWWASGYSPADGALLHSLGLPPPSNKDSSTDELLAFARSILGREVARGAPDIRSLAEHVLWLASQWRDAGRGLSEALPWLNRDMDLPVWAEEWWVDVGLD